MYKEYLKILGPIPKFLNKYLEDDFLKRLKNVGYFCGMDYASNDIYDFDEYISRFDHSLNVALMTYKFTKDKKATIAGLFHDISTPCFSHVIDYMNKDYNNQESTEEYTETILRKDKKLLELLKKDNIKIEEIINFKRYPIVDNNRPRLCADRLDSIILASINITKGFNITDIELIINDLKIFKNEDGIDEMGFKNIDIAKKVLKENDDMDFAFHSDYDKYMMELLAEITRYSISKNYIKYEDLYVLDEETLYNNLKLIDNDYLKELIFKFENIKLSEIEKIDLPNIKTKDLDPLVNGIRLKTIITE